MCNKKLRLFIVKVSVLVYFPLCVYGGVYIGTMPHLCATHSVRVLILVVVLGVRRYVFVCVCVKCEVFICDGLYS